MEGAYDELAEMLDGTATVVAKHQADLDKDYSQRNLGLTTFPTIIFVRAKTKGMIKYPSERRGAETLKMWIKTVGGGL